MSSYPLVILSDSPAAYWRLGESSGVTAADASGNGHTGTYVNAPTLAQTGSNQTDTDTSVLFVRASGHRVSVADDVSLRAASFSVEAWVYRSTTTADYQMALSKTNAGWTNGYGLYHISGSIYFFVNHYATGAVSAALSRNTWHHVVGTFDGTTARLYLDGVEIGTPVSGITLTHSTGTLYLASEPNLAIYFWDGLLDEVAIYGATLSAAQVRDHYAEWRVLASGARVTQYAVSGLCRSEATRSDYYLPVGQVQIGGTLRSRMVDKRTVRISADLTAQSNTCEFECFDFTPLRGQEVIISIGTLTNRLFAGHILSVSQVAAHADQRVRFAVQCVDYTWLLDSRRITGCRYVGESVTNIVNDLMTRFAPSGFTTTTVEASMDAVDFTANHAETLMQAVQRLMKMASKGTYVGGRCYVDYTKRLHAFCTPETDGNPLTLQASNKNFRDLTYRIDLSQVRTRVYVLGGTTRTTSPVPNSSSAIPVEDTVKFSSTGGLALAYGNQLTYTSRSPVSGQGWLTGVTSFAFSLPQGESVRVVATRVNSNAAASIAAIIGSGNGLIDHVLDDERLGNAGAITRGDGDLGIFASPEEGVSFISRDKFIIPGKMLPVSLTAPSTIATSLTVQRVEITDIGIGTAPRFPLRRVDAATSYRDTFQILASADQVSTEGQA